MTAVIELGDDWSPPEAEPAPLRRLSIRTRVGVVVVMALALLGGAGPPRAPLMSLVVDIATVAPTAVLLTSTDVYVGGADGALIDYAVPGGAPRWRTTLPYAVGELNVDAQARVLVVIASEDVPQIGQISALSSDNGAKLWSVDRSTIVDARPGRLLLERRGPAIAPEIRWLDIRTGRAVWTRTIAAGADVAAAGAPVGGGQSGGGQLGGGQAGGGQAGGGQAGGGQAGGGQAGGGNGGGGQKGGPNGGDQADEGPVPVLVTELSGSAILLNALNGQVIAMGDVGSLVSNLVLTPGPAGAAGPPVAGRDPVDLFGDAILVQERPGAAPGSLTAFDVATLAHRWVVTGDLLGVPFRCGPNVCIGSVDGLRAFDPSTGAVRWRSDQWQYATALDNGRLIAFSIGLSASPPSAAGLDNAPWFDAAPGGQATGVLDADTGRTLVNLGDSDVRFVANQSGPALLAVATEGSDYTWYGLDTAPVGMHVLGTLGGVDPRFCLAAGDLVGCVTQGTTIRVWRVGG